jgi:bifunctional UDP-N-acetylglucosamine pyrophosphorylase/glucosamine-1-phosphate N-acetyltransferase
VTTSPLPPDAVCAIILAAGEGSRMESDIPKPLHEVCGTSMVMHVVQSLESIPLVATVVVVGHRAPEVSAHVQQQAPDWARIRFVTQHEQNGTGDAAAVGLTGLTADDCANATAVLVMPGDTPLLTSHTISRLLTEHTSTNNAATVLTAVLDDPTGYGRIVRDKTGNVVRIVEHRDASPDELNIREINTGIYLFEIDLFGPALKGIGANNSQAEYYLTDVVAVLASTGHSVGSVIAPASETAGVNDPQQLAEAEREMLLRTTAN